MDWCHDNTLQVQLAVSYQGLNYIMTDSRFATSQLEILQSNNVSHLLGTNLKSAMYMVDI